MSLVFGLILFLTLLGDHYGNCSHFRGGTISWKPIHGQTVEFKFKMGWTYNSGPGCNENRIGEFVNESFIGDKDWKCVNGCDQPIVKVGPAYYYCTAASKSENWEQGEHSFQYTFKKPGPFVVSYTGAMWMSLSFGNPNEWVLQTTIDLRFRDDINSTNTSPITASKPLYTLQFACYHELQLPMFDPDGDLVKCRWARGKECASVCKAVPVADLDEDTCTLKFNASGGNQYKEDGWYAVALTIEDFPRKTIHVGKEVFKKTTALTTVPLQFLIHLVGKKTACYMKPEFIAPTPSEGTKISIPASKKFDLKIYAANLHNNNIRITKLSLTRPAGMIFTGPVDDPSKKGAVFWELSWTPTAKDRGNHIVCAMAEDVTGHISDTRCITLIAWDLPTDPCANHPCRGNLTCSRIGSTQKIECICPVGFSKSGQFCITVITTTKLIMTTKPTPKSSMVTTTLVLTTTPTTSSSTITTTIPRMPSTKPTSVAMTTKPAIVKTSSTKTISVAMTTRPAIAKISSTKTTYATMTTTRPMTTIKRTSAMPTSAVVLTTQSTTHTHMSTLPPTTTQALPSTTNMATSKSWMSTRSHTTPHPQNGISTNKQSFSKQQQKTSSSGHSGCFKSKPVVLFTAFFSVLLIALSAGVITLTYILIKTKNQIRDLAEPTDKFDIDSGK